MNQRLEATVDWVVSVAPSHRGGPVEPVGFVYVWVNNVNGHCYIGQTTNFKQRTKCHFNKSSGCKVFSAAIAKYGKHSFTPIVRECRVSAMAGLEMTLITVFRSSNIKLYNLTNGGNAFPAASARATPEQRGVSKEVALRTWADPVVRRKRIAAMRAAGVLTKQYGTKGGERNSSAKLNPEKVRAIRDRYANGGATLKLLAAEYGVTFAIIQKIVKRRLWRHVK